MAVSLTKANATGNPQLVNKLAGRVEARILAHALQSQTTELLCSLAGQKNFTDTKKTIRKLNAIRKQLAQLEGMI